MNEADQLLAEWAAMAAMAASAGERSGGHSPACLEKLNQAMEERSRFDREYPNVCKRCDGSGVIHYTENQSPIGSGEYWGMDMDDDCEVCIGRGVCPRCGTENLYYNEDDEFDIRCRQAGCGYVSRRDLIIRPPEPECECWADGGF